MKILFAVIILSNAVCMALGFAPHLFFRQMRTTTSLNMKSFDLESNASTCRQIHSELQRLLAILALSTSMVVAVPTDASVAEELPPGKCKELGVKPQKHES